MADTDRARLQAVDKKVNELQGELIGVACTVADMQINIGAQTNQISRLQKPADLWTKIAGAAAGVSALAAVVGILVSHRQASNTRTSLEGQVSEIKTEQAKLSVALRLLAANVANDKLLHEFDKALAEVASSSQSGDKESTRKILTSLTAQATTLRQRKVPASQDFFTEAHTVISHTSVVNPEVANVTLQAVADYRSAVLFPDNLATTFAYGLPGSLSAADIANIPRDHDGRFKGFMVYQTPQVRAKAPFNTVGMRGVILVNQGKDDLFVTAGEDGKSHGTIKDVLIVTPSQTLDDLNWDDVVFVNAVIKYNGGLLSLNHVVFVNCTFEVTPQSGTPLLNYALLGKDKVQADKGD